MDSSGISGQFEKSFDSAMESVPPADSFTLTPAKRSRSLDVMQQTEPPTGRAKKNSGSIAQDQSSTALNSGKSIGVKIPHFEIIDPNDSDSTMFRFDDPLNDDEHFSVHAIDSHVIFHKTFPSSQSFGNAQNQFEFPKSAMTWLAEQLAGLKPDFSSAELQFDGERVKLMRVFPRASSAEYRSWLTIENQARSNHLNSSMTQKMSFPEDFLKQTLLPELNRL